MKPWPRSLPKPDPVSIREWSQFCSVAMSSGKSSRACSPCKCRRNFRPISRSSAAWLPPRASPTPPKRLEPRSPPAGTAERLAAARLQAQNLTEFGRGLGGSLTLDDTLSLLSVRLKRLVPHDSMAVYLRKNNLLAAEFVSGENFRLFSSLRIPLGEGLSGWVAQNHKPILNGNPSVEPGYLNNPTQYSTLRSALAVPLEGSAGVVAVLALYRARPDAFTRDDLQVLEVLCLQPGSRHRTSHHPQGCRHRRRRRLIESASPIPSLSRIRTRAPLSSMVLLLGPRIVPAICLV